MRTHVLPGLISCDGHALLGEEKALTAAAAAVAVVLISGNEPASGGQTGTAGRLERKASPFIGSWERQGWFWGPEAV